MHKGLQLGGAIGASSSVLLALAGPRGFRFVKRLVQITALTSTAGMATGVGGAVKKISSLPESEQQDGIEDRAFRIFHNRKQVDPPMIHLAWLCGVEFIPFHRLFSIAIVSSYRFPPPKIAFEYLISHVE